MSGKAAINLEAEKQALEPWWFTVDAAVTGSTPESSLPAVEVRFIPIGRVALRTARRAAAAAIGNDLPEDDDAPLPPELIEHAGDILSESLLMSGIDQWRGVGDQDGEPVEVTPERLRIFLLADPIRFEKLDEAYVRPFVMRELEKNVLSLSLNGISAGATPVPDTAKKHVRRTEKAGAKRTPKRARKKPAPTDSMNRKATPAPASGT
ncbi:hypothetical protein [Sphingobium sp. Z007]|uniref:hypothetical protein n=1 Tax=Sphingobium sp. Z007 TaxID=627495 RepID=UPI000B4984BC|nr:hypothetical protein [Sphingobium sp. Z007]